MLVTNQAKMIRTTIGDMRVIGRGSAGIKLFEVGEGEQVVSVARIEENEEEAEAVLTDAAPDEPAAVVEVAEPVQVDDGTGPHTNSQAIIDEDEEDGDAE